MTTPILQDRFQTLIEENKKILYKVCNAYGNSRDDREDLTQEIIVQLWRSFGAFDARYQFSTWMYRVALNVAISYNRRESTRKRYLISADDQRFPGALYRTEPSGPFRLDRLLQRRCDHVRLTVRQLVSQPGKANPFQPASALDGVRHEGFPARR